VQLRVGDNLVRIDDRRSVGLRSGMRPDDVNDVPDVLEAARRLTLVQMAPSSPLRQQPSARRFRPVRSWGCQDTRGPRRARHATGLPLPGALRVGDDVPDVASH
jgi:hypothetical protein